MEPATAIVLLFGTLTLGAPTCFCEAPDAGPVWSETGGNPDNNATFC